LLEQVSINTEITQQDLYIYIDLNVDIRNLIIQKENKRHFCNPLVTFITHRVIKVVDFKRERERTEN